jgi:hypothetical protein
MTASPWTTTSAGDGAPEQIAPPQAWVRGEEVIGAGIEAAAFGRLRNGSCPARGERGVEPLRAAMDLAGALRSSQEPPRCFVRTMAPVQHPRDAEVIPVAHPALEQGPCLPCIRELVVRHGDSCHHKPTCFTGLLLARTRDGRTGERLMLLRE